MYAAIGPAGPGGPGFVIQCHKLWTSNLKGTGGFDLVYVDFPQRFGIQKRRCDWIVEGGRVGETGPVTLPLLDSK